jgi:hypothetical protein
LGYYLVKYKKSIWSKAKQMRRKFKTKIIIWLVLTLLPASIIAKTNTNSAIKSANYKTWVTAMKQAPRGPFSGIRWFCSDGVILQARDYTCNVHGGGVQHGLWNQQTKKIRADGYQFANVFADFDSKRFFRSSQWRENLAQVLLERFLIGFDDGWIFRKARSYRGALQVEDETDGAKVLLNSLFQKVDKFSKRSKVQKNDQDFLLLREAYRLLPRQNKSASLTSVRNLTTKIDLGDKNFSIIRNKIHNQPDRSDAQRVRSHAQKIGLPSLKKDYQNLASSIDKVYARGNANKAIMRFANSLQKGDLKTVLLNAAKKFTPSTNDEIRLIESAELLRSLRERYPYFRTNYTRYLTLELSMQLEQEAFVAANKLAKKAKYASRSQNIKWLGALGTAIYGTGLISERQWKAFNGSLQRLTSKNVVLGQYRKELHYLNRIPGWANQWLKFHFNDASNSLSKIEPLVVHFIPDRLRSNPILAYGLILDQLSIDANALSGVQHQFFGKIIGAGLRPLNAGLARGLLHLPTPDSPSENNKPDKNSIVLLPETTAELSPVAGILTMGEGNALSHVQLLAGNLGIPNVVIDEKLQSLLKPLQNSMVVLAVSPGGIVQLEADSTKWHEYFSRQITPQAKSEEDMIKPNLEKLDLQQRSLISLADLRAENAGRITGPKAANLGELKYHFPKAVTSGLVIPFGVYRELLEQPYEDTNLTVFAWMQSEYQRVRGLDAEQEKIATKTLQNKLRQWLLQAKPSAEFRKKLAKSLRAIFGKDGSYSVFVRSDTNVEDLPGFTGAGLNLTVPNVKGFDNILKAISKVWASPFSERAFAWRQQRMTSPEHVYPSVLLLKSVEVDKSGVMLSLDTDTGERNILTIAVNEGIGGAVQGQSAEELSIDLSTAKTQLLAEATASKKRMLNRKGGLIKKQRKADGQVLTIEEIAKLIQLSQQQEAKFPQYGESGEKTAADIEFGFKNGELVLFQVRPYLQNRRVKKNHYLNMLDQALNDSTNISVNMNEVPSS